MSLPPYRHVPPLEMTVSAGSIQSFSGANYPKRYPASPVISTEAKRSGEISRRKAASPIVAGDLSALRFIRDEYLSLITTGSPARDDDSGRQHTVIRRETNWPKRCPAPRHFNRSEAEWRNLTPKCGKLHSGRRSLGSAFH